MANNAERISRAKTALDAYDGKDNTPGNIGDLITDLLHLCADDEGDEFDAERVMRVAFDNYEAEQNDETHHA